MDLDLGHGGTPVTLRDSGSPGFCRWMGAPGNHATPFQGHVLKTARREQTFAPSYHFVTDMGSNEAWTNLPGGPSESRFSRLYEIDVARWVSGEYKRLATD